MWLFGYGSLIFRPSFPFLERRQAWIKGWERRFWQGSPDHRGTPEAPGRVVTLIAAPDSWCAGVAYKLDAAEADRILTQVDAREQAGFERIDVTLYDESRESSFARGVVYVAGPSNAHYAGAASVDEIASHIARSAGPSGPNADYLLQLADALRAMGASDPHVEALAARVIALRGGRSVDAA